MPESLKNILLVMANSGFLVAPAEGEAPSPLWAETWKRLGRFLPHLYGELYSDATTPREPFASNRPSTASNRPSTSEEPAVAEKS